MCSRLLPLLSSAALASLGLMEQGFSPSADIHLKNSLHEENVTSSQVDRTRWKGNILRQSGAPFFWSQRELPLTERVKSQAAGIRFRLAAHTARREGAQLPLGPEPPCQRAPLPRHEVRASTQELAGTNPRTSRRCYGFNLLLDVYTLTLAFGGVHDFALVSVVALG